MRGVVVIAAAIVVLFLAVVVLGVIGPFVAGAGLVAALVVVLDPGGAGARLRQSPGWWGIPGMRAASRGAAPFALMLLLYAVPAPLAAFGLVHAVRSGPPAPPGPEAGLGMGGGSGPAAGASPGAMGGTSPAASGAASATPATAPPTATPSAAPTPAATAEGTPAASLQPIPVSPVAPTPRPPTPQPTPPPQPTPTPTAQNLCGAPSNPWNYNFCGGSGRITSPPSNFCSYFTCIASFWQQTNGYVEECTDGTYSHSGGVSGSCSGHKGNQRALNP